MIKTNIAFSQVREDPEIDLFLCNSIKKNNKKALMIGSGGESIFTLLLCPDIQEIDLIDANPEQIELIKLKMEAIRQLSPIEYLHFVESDNYSDKTKTYKSLLDNSILDISYWNTKENLFLIEYGINQIGVFEQLFKELRDCFDVSPVNSFNDNTWNNAFSKIFNRQKLINAFGEEAVKYSMSKEFSDHFSFVMKNAIEKYQNNYFIDQVFHGRYLKDKPIFLNPENYKIIQEKLNKINIIQNQFHQHVKNSKEKYDFIHTSNITDWLPLNTLDELYNDINKCLLPNGIVVSRRLNGDHSLKDIIGKVFDATLYFPNVKKSHISRNQIDLSKTINENDTSYFYSEVLYGKRA